MGYTPEEIWDTLMDYQKKYPELTFQNEGYTYLPKEILSKYGYVINNIFLLIQKVFPQITEFNHFITKKNKVILRFQGKWDSYFTGVYYVDKETFLRETNEKRISK